MKGRFLCFLLALQVVNFVGVAKRPLLPNDGISHQAQKGALHSSQPYTMESKKGMLGKEGNSAETRSEETYDKEVSKVGSSPPSCENKCYGCVPCEAIQVPNTSSSRNRRSSHNLGLQYANYEPESWKCKCGPSFYSP